MVACYIHGYHQSIFMPLSIMGLETLFFWVVCPCACACVHMCLQWRHSPTTLPSTCVVMLWVLCCLEHGSEAGAVGSTAWDEREAWWTDAWPRIQAPGCSASTARRAAAAAASGGAVGPARVHAASWARAETASPVRDQATTQEPQGSSTAIDFLQPAVCVSGSQGNHLSEKLGIDHQLGEK